MEQTHTQWANAQELRNERAHCVSNRERSEWEQVGRVAAAELEDFENAWESELYQGLATKEWPEHAEMTKTAAWEAMYEGFQEKMREDIEASLVMCQSDIIKAAEWLERLSRYAKSVERHEHANGIGRIKGKLRAVANLLDLEMDVEVERD